MCLSPRSPSRLGIVKSWNIEVGRDPRDRRGSSAPGGVRVSIASSERREREWDFSRLPWPVTRGIGIINPYSRPGSCGRNPNVLTSIFFVVDGDVQRTSGIPCIPGGCVWMDGSQLVELRAHVPSRNALFPGCSILCGLYPNLQILTLVFLVGFH